MNVVSWLTSPLAGTAGVMLGLALIAVPLRKLTSAEAAPQKVAAPLTVATTDTPAVLRIKLLAPVKQLSIKTPSGATLLEIPATDAGESEHDIALPLIQQKADLLLEADFCDAPSETAVFLTVMPDSLDEQTRYVIGSGKLRETLRFKWVHTD